MFAFLNTITLLRRMSPFAINGDLSTVRSDVIRTDNEYAMPFLIVPTRRHFRNPITTTSLSSDRVLLAMISILYATKAYV